MVICLQQSANDLHMVQLMPLPTHHLCFSKIQNGLSFWYRPTQVVLEKRLSNDCVCVYMYMATASLYNAHSIPGSCSTQVVKHCLTGPFLTAKQNNLSEAVLDLPNISLK